MIERVLLVAWKGSSATSWVETLRSGGYTVLLEDTTGERAWRTAKERGIDCVIIDGQKKPSHGRQTGHALRDTAKTRNIPIIWTNLDSEDSESVRTEVKPDVTLIAPTDAGGALAALQTLHSERALSAESGEVSATPEPPPEPAPEPEEVLPEPVPAAPKTKAIRKPVAARKAAPKKAPAKKPAAKKPATKAKKSRAR